MGKIKSIGFDLTESLSEEELQDLGIQINKAEQDSYYSDGLSMSYEPLLD